MISKLLACSTLVLSLSVSAAPDWTKVTNVSLGTVFLDRASVTSAGEFVRVRILRNYDQLVTLGNDPVTNETWYPHRSVKLDYLANCETGKVALESWQMYSKGFGNGELVWADREPGSPSFLIPSNNEESSALIATCSSRGG
jgi:hypothetical protein